jgi:deoxyribodipyrimidine photo-lyase
VAHVPSVRVRVVCDAPLAPDQRYVLYWMIAARRPFDNFALQHAVAYAKSLGRPLVILEALRVAYPWASARLHAFVIEGMHDNARAFAGKPVTYYPYVEPSPGAGSGLLEALASHACVVVTDDYPCFFLPRMVASAGAKLGVRLEAVDASGLLPVRSADKAHLTAYSFRRYLQHQAEHALSELASEAPLARAALPTLDALPSGIAKRWPSLELTRAVPELVASLPIDHAVGVAPELRGGHAAAERQLHKFVKGALARYGEERSHPDARAASGLSPWLHFGHIATQRIFKAVAEAEGWDGTPRGEKKNGSREGFWGVSPSAESFLDELITWRELCFNTAAFLPDYHRYTSLPEWAQKTLAKHASDPRQRLYDLATLEAARTYDPVWNAAQRELVEHGRMQNYLRMLWGKKILEWSPTPEEALERALHLNNKYAIDGRDPNSYGGVFWVFGRYDRPWAPERPIFGTIRYMTSDSAQRKLRMKAYLSEHGAGQLSL